MENPIIQVSRLTYRVGKKYLLKNIDWSIEKGEHWVVFGLNGSGKTTLLSMLAGYKTPTSGKLKVFGEAYSDDNMIAFRKRIGLVSTSCFDQFYGAESALEIILSGKYGSVGLDFDVLDKDVKMAKKLLSLMGLKDKCDQAYNTMSKGEREIVLILRALIAKPDILILDEPCSGLDITARDKMLGLIDRLAKEGEMSIIYVTHYADEILPCFEHALLLRRGRVYKKGLSTDLFTEEVMSAFIEEKMDVDYDNRGRMRLYSAEKGAMA